MPLPPANERSDPWLLRLRHKLRGRLFGASSPGVESATAAPPKPVRSELLPDRIGRYRVIGRIGVGGMGVIYAARDEALDRTVAVKLLRPEGPEPDRQARARLMREAQALARLSHPGVVAVYEVGEHDDQVFIAMELVEGETLRAWQSGPDVPWRAVLRTYAAAGRGLGAAHRAGIVHRDFKPDNVLVRRDGEVRVIDFGLARSTLDPSITPVPAELPHERPADEPLTRTGMLMGTPAYMAPEQFRGESADARSDQFAFCVALWEALYGFRPFSGTTVGQLARSVLRGRIETPPRYTDVPDRVYRVLSRGLSNDPQLRYPSIDVLVGELPLEHVDVRRIGFGMAAVAVAGGLGGTWWWADRSEAVTRDVEATAQVSFERKRLRATESELGRVRHRALAERWNEVVLASASQAVETDPTRALGMLERLQPHVPGWIEPAKMLAAAALERDFKSREIAPGVGPIVSLSIDRSGDTTIVGRRAAVQWRSLQGALEPLATFEDDVLAARASDGGYVLVTHEASGYVRTHVRGRGRTRQLRVDPSGSGSSGSGSSGEPVSLALSTNGRWAACAAGRAVSTWLGDGSGRPTTFVGTSSVVALAFQPDSDVLYGLDSQGRLVRWAPGLGDGTIVARGLGTARDLRVSSGGDVVDLQMKSGAVQRVLLATSASTTLPVPAAVQGFDRAATSDTLVAIDGSGGVHVWSEGMSEPRRLDSVGATATAIASDASRVAVAIGDSVRSWQLGREHVEYFLVHDGAIAAVDVYPDSGTIAIGTSAGSVRLWELGSGQSRSIGHLVGGIGAVSFSPDGRRIAAVGGLGGITVWDLEGTAGPVTVSAGGSIRPPIVWSDDGSTLAVQACNAPRRCGLVVQDLTDDARVISTRLGRPLRSWAVSSDGRWVLAVREPGHDVAVYMQDGSVLRPSWPPGVVVDVVAHAFTDEAAVHLALLHDERLALWRWWPQAGELVQLEDRYVSAAVPDRGHQALLVRSGGRQWLWSVGEVLLQPIADVSPDVRSFELSADRMFALLPSTEGLEVMHLPTGVRRRYRASPERVAWAGHGLLVTIEGLSHVQAHIDPTPRDPEAFMAFVAQLTDADVPLGP